MCCHYAIFTAFYSPHMGGIEQFVEHLSLELLAVGNKVDIITSEFDGLPIHETPRPGLAIWRLPSTILLNGRLPLLRRGKSFDHVMGQFSKNAYDGLLVNSRYYDISLCGVKFGCTNSIPTVLLDHSSSYIGFGVPALDLFVRAYERIRTEHIKKYNPFFCGVSRKSAEWLKHFSIEPRGIIHNAIDANEFRSLCSERRFREEFGITTDSFVVAFTGRLVEGKGADILMEVARACSAMRNDIVFAIAGDGPQYKKLSLACPDNCMLLGRLSREDISALLKEVDAFCFPSTYPEGMPTSLLEAGAWGLPIITTDVGGAREIIPDEDYGIILKDANPTKILEAVIRLADDRHASSRMGTRVRNRIEESFGWRQSAQSFIELVGARNS